MKRLLPLIIGIAVLVAALSSLSKGISRNAQPDVDDDDQSQSQTQQQAKPATPAVPNTPLQAHPMAPSGYRGNPGATTETVPPELTVGDPKTAKYHVVIGWNYDPSNVGNSKSTSDAIKAAAQIAQQSNGKVSVQAVDVDVPDSERSPATRGIQQVGVNVVGVPGYTMKDNPGEGAATPPNITRMLTSLPK